VVWLPPAPEGCHKAAAPRAHYATPHAEAARQAATQHHATHTAHAVPTHTAHTAHTRHTTETEARHTQPSLGMSKSSDLVK